MQRSKRKIIKTRAGELGHLDSHYLTVVGTKHRLVGLIDAYTRLAWAEVVGDSRVLCYAMVLKSINFLNAEYGIGYPQ